MGRGVRGHSLCSQNITICDVGAIREKVYGKWVYLILIQVVLLPMMAECTVAVPTLAVQEKTNFTTNSPPRGGQKGRLSFI
jgi:hypothetical protein